MPDDIRTTLIRLIEEARWLPPIRNEVFALARRFYINLMKTPLAMKPTIRACVAMIFAQRILHRRHHYGIRVSVPKLGRAFGVSHSSIYAWTRNYDVREYKGLFALIRLKGRAPNDTI